VKEGYELKYSEAARRFIGQYDNHYTREGYLQTINLLERYVGEQKDIAKITTADLLDFANDLRSENYHYSHMTIYRHIKQTKIFFNWMVKMGFITTNPATNLRNPAPAKNIERNKAMTDAELESILRVAYGDAVKYALVLFLADTGCRAGGAATLRMEKLNLGERKAFVTEKGGRSRWVYFEEECELALRHWLKKREDIVAQSIERDKTTKDHGFVFCHAQGEYSADGISQIITRLGNLAGIGRHLGSHALRHRKGHQLADAGVAASVAANLLGHTDSKITLDYYYPRDDSRVEEAARKLAYQTKGKPSKIVRFKSG
jgi:site-specific recombinase XerD